MHENNFPPYYRAWWRVLPALAVGIALAACAVADADPAAKADEEDTAVADVVVVTVNSHAITRNDVDRALEAAIGFPLASLPVVEREELCCRFGPAIEEQLIDEALLAAAARKAGIPGPDAIAQLLKRQTEGVADTTACDVEALYPKDVEARRVVTRFLCEIARKKAVANYVAGLRKDAVIERHDD